MRISSAGPITEATSRTLRGGTPAASTSNGGAGGGGSGGLYIAVSAGGYTLNSGITISCPGGGGGDTRPGLSGRDGGAGGIGRVILMFVDAPTINGTISQAVLSRVQILRGLSVAAAFTRR